MYYLARSLQLLGLLEAGYGLFIGLYAGNIGLELKHGGLGVLIFVIGWWVQKYAANR